MTDFIDNFNYNRDRITDASSPDTVTLSPMYGSTVSFKSDNTSWYGSSNYNFIIPNGLNSIRSDMNLQYAGSKSEIKSLLKRIEDITSGEITGMGAFNGSGNCLNFGETVDNVTVHLDRNNIYNNFSGSQLASYALTHLSDDVYQIQLNLFNNRLSPFFTSGMAFVNSGDTQKVAPVTYTAHGNISSYITIPTDKSPFFVAMYNDGTGGIDNTTNVFDQFYYLKGPSESAVNGSTKTFRTNAAHSSNQGIGPGIRTYTGSVEGDGASDYSLSRTFFWQPDRNVVLNIGHEQRENSFKNSFHRSLNLSRNQNTIKDLRLTFSQRNDFETYSILHFLESHLGYKTFVYEYDDDIIEQKRVFYCNQWSHTFDYFDLNTVTATFTEIANPVTPNF